MIRKILLSFASCILLLMSNEATASFWNKIHRANLHPSLILGSGHTTVGGAQNVWLAQTPEPGLENTYSSGGKQNNTIFVGLALEKSFTTKKIRDFESAVGIELGYLRNSSMKGIVQPMVNVAPDFDILNYSYTMSSYLLLATGKLSKLNIIAKMGGYIQGGIGTAYNQLSNYTETSPANSSAAPMLAPFGDRSKLRFAYSIGAGILFQVSKATQVLIGYRYINLGPGGFNTSPAQQTNDTLDFKLLGNHFLTISIIV